MSVDTITRIKEPPYIDDEDDGMGDFALREDLHWKVKREARELRTISRGVMLISGEPGSGKDLFGISFCARQRYLFNRKILLDFTPKRAWQQVLGDYTPFDATVMMNEINKMAKLARVEGIDSSVDDKEYDEFIGEATEKWALEGEGESLLQGAILYLSELKRYCPCREPMNRFNKFIGSINSIWRHLDLLNMGTHVLPREIDKTTFLAYAKFRARCSWSMTEAYTTDVTISRGAFVGPDAIYNVEGRPVTFHVNGKEPRKWLGGKSYFNLYKSKNYVNLKPVVRKEMQGG
jgi:hypothetical protein